MFEYYILYKNQEKGILIFFFVGLIQKKLIKQSSASGLGGGMAGEGCDGLLFVRGFGFP